MTASTRSCAATPTSADPLFEPVPGPEGSALIAKRFMVRGHWRRANLNWADQRLRWIEPYWKGPELATIIEKQYRARL